MLPAAHEQLSGLGRCAKLDTACGFGGHDRNSDPNTGLFSCLDRPVSTIYGDPVLQGYYLYSQRTFAYVLDLESRCSRFTDLQILGRHLKPRRELESQGDFN